MATLARRFARRGPHRELHRHCRPSGDALAGNCGPSKPPEPENLSYRGDDGGDCRTHGDDKAWRGLHQIDDIAGGEAHGTDSCLKTAVSGSGKDRQIEILGRLSTTFSANFDWWRAPLD
jgi:hypothetical protein